LGQEKTNKQKMEKEKAFFSEADSIRVVHGSLDSVDLDVIYLLPCSVGRLPLGSELAEFQKQHPDEDVNFAVFDPETHHVVDCVRGVPSECCNMLLKTTECSFLERMERSTGEKLLDCLQKSVILIRRCPCVREEAISCLRANSAQTMVRLIQKMDVKELSLSADQGKQLAFMWGQVAGLMLKGAELYDKTSLVEHFPFLRPVLYRKSLSGLEQIISLVLEQPFRLYQSGAVVVYVGPEGSRSVCQFEKNRARCLLLTVPHGAKGVKWGQKQGVVFDAQDGSVVFDSKALKKMEFAAPGERLKVYY
jgi:hypothetical protein